MNLHPEPIASIAMTERCHAKKQAMKGSFRGLERWANLTVIDFMVGLKVPVVLPRDKPTRVHRRKDDRNGHLSKSHREEARPA
jgi:hypothetical protein